MQKFLWIIFALFTNIQIYSEMQEELIVYFERSGGFTGIILSVELSSNEMSSEEQDSLLNLINTAHFFEYNNDDGIKRNVPDQFQYKLSIEKGEKHQSLIFSDQLMPEEFIPLVRYLTQKSIEANR